MSLSIMILIILTVVIAALAGYRQVIAHNADACVHMADPNGTIMAEQKKMATSLAKIDRFGIAVTLATAAYGLLLRATSFYQSFAHPAVQ